MEVRHNLIRIILIKVSSNNEHSIRITVSSLCLYSLERNDALEDQNKPMQNKKISTLNPEYVVLLKMC